MIENSCSPTTKVLKVFGLFIGSIYCSVIPRYSTILYVFTVILSPLYIDGNA